MTEWEPATEAEVAMRDALRANDQELYFRILAQTELLLPVSAQALAGTAPMGWGTWTTGGRTHVLAFTSGPALQVCLAENAGSVRRAAYHELAASWPNAEWWLAVNPGLPIEGYLPAWFVSQLARGDVQLPGRTLAARARLERAENVARARATASVPGRVASPDEQGSAPPPPVVPAGAPVANGAVGAANGQTRNPWPDAEPNGGPASWNPAPGGPDQPTTWAPGTAAPQSPEHASPGATPPPGFATQPPGFGTRPPGFGTQPPGAGTRPAGFATQPPGFASPDAAQPASPAAPPPFRPAAPAAFAPAAFAPAAFAPAGEPPVAPSGGPSAFPPAGPGGPGAIPPGGPPTGAPSGLPTRVPSVPVDQPAYSASTSAPPAAGAASRVSSLFEPRRPVRATRAYEESGRGGTERTDGPAGREPYPDSPGPRNGRAPWLPPSADPASNGDSPGVPGDAPTPASGPPAGVAPGGAGPAGFAPVAASPASPAATAPGEVPADGAASQVSPGPSGAGSGSATHEEPAAGVGASAPAAAGPTRSDFVPANDVERSLLAAAGDGSTDTFLSTLLLAKVLLPVSARSAPGARPGDDGFDWRSASLDGETYVIVFTSAERLADHLPEPLETIAVRFVQLIREWPDSSWSFAVNPGTPVGAKLPGAQIVGLANWAAEVGLGDEAEPAEPVEVLAADEPAPRSTYAPMREDPTRPTMMQKAIAPSQVDYYLDRGYDRISGYVHRASEVAHLNTPAKLYAALGLGYAGSLFSPGASEIHVLRWPAHRPSLYRIPYGGQTEAAMRAMEGWVIERPPFRGNGFAPGESSDVVAEFKVDSVRLPYGAELWQIGADGTERLVARLDTDVTRWRRVGGE